MCNLIGEVPTARELSSSITEAVAKSLHCQTYVVGGAARGDREARDIDLVVMKATAFDGTIFDCVEYIKKQYPALAVEIAESSDPAEIKQNDARFIFRFYCSDIPVELSFPWDDCDGLIYNYMSAAYPLSVQECCLTTFMPQLYYDAWGKDIIYVKKWLNWENAFNKYRTYYPDAQFVFVTKDEFDLIKSEKGQRYATYKERPCSF